MEMLRLCGFKGCMFAGMTNRKARFHTGTPRAGQTERAKQVKFPADGAFPSQANAGYPPLVYLSTQNTQARIHFCYYYASQI